MLTPRRDTPVVELLHPVAGDPQARPLPGRVVGQVRTARFEITDQLLQRFEILHLPGVRPQHLQRLIDTPVPQRLKDRRLDRTAVLATATGPAEILTTTLHQVPPADDHRPA